jgi:non-specific serine/threonine protein kinase
MTQLALQLNAALADRYEIEREIGAGAVAVVFLARDRKHDRLVAIKVLRPEFAEGVSPARFQREIAIAASLHHPHILPLFDSGEVDGLTYFTMPYVEGQTLRQMLQRDRMLPLPVAVRLARQVASALSYAHGRGIVHRDIKPENILMAEGVPQIADFGVAGAFPSLTAERITKTGAVVGTAPYMSPEQWNGVEPVDERADVYSLGIVLYEMIVGLPPFAGRTAQVIMARHMMDPVPPMHSARPTVPQRLEHAVQRALAKVPGDRYDSLAQFATELAEIEAEGRLEVGTRSASAPRSSAVSRVAPYRPGILVLPFLNLSTTSGDDFLGSGLTDEIITSLSGLQALRVISYTTATQLRNTNKDVRTLGRELNVTYVLEGSVRREGENLRVRTRLVAAETEESVWQYEYKETIAGLLELEKSISRAVVEALAVRLSTNERKRLAEHRIADARAFEYYVRARQEVYKFTEEALDRALDYLQKGLALCGDSVAIWAAMGQVYWQYINAGISGDTSYFQRARECADRILEIDPDSPEARRLLGLLEINAKGDPQVAVDHLKASLESNPNDPESLFWLSIIYGFAGRPSTGYALAIRLLEIDPLTPLYYVVPGFLDVLDGDAERGVPWLARAHGLEPNNPIIGIAYGQALAMSGHIAEARSVLEGIQEYVPDSVLALIGRALSCAVTSRPAEARQAITQEVIDLSRHDLQYSWTLAQCYALLGDLTEACDWTENAVRHGFWNYPLLSDRDPMLVAVRHDSRYLDIMKSTKKKWLDFRA